MSKPIRKLSSQEIDTQVKQMAAALRDAGLRLTPQRVAVCRALAESQTHPTAQGLFEQLSARSAAFSRATVYNTLETLTRHGLARELVVAGDGAMRYDANARPHAHLVCTRCHRVDDYDDDALDRSVQRVSGQTGYALQGLGVFYHGLCPECQKKR